MTTFLDRRYLQFAFGGIKPSDFPSELKNSYPYSAARTTRVIGSYFFGSVSGFKSFLKLGNLVNQGLKLAGRVVSPQAASFFSTCTLLKNFLTAGESYTALGQLKKPLRQFSVWGGSSSQIGQALTKGAEVGAWIMPVCDTYTWFAKIGIFAERLIAGRIFHLASTVSLANSYQTEFAKWWTGQIIESSGSSKQFTIAEKVKSFFNLMTTTSLAFVTAISVAEMAGCVIPSASLYIFASLSVAAVSKLAGHCWEELQIKE